MNKQRFNMVLEFLDQRIDRDNFCIYMHPRDALGQAANDSQFKSEGFHIHPDNKCVSFIVDDKVYSSYDAVAKFFDVSWFDAIKIFGYSVEVPIEIENRPETTAEKIRKYIQ